MSRAMANLEYADLSDVGRRRLANEDACHCDARMGLFVVCDGIGGQPSGEAAAQIIAHSLDHLIRRRVRGLDRLDAATLKDLLVQTVRDLSRQFHTESRTILALASMGATLVALLIDGNGAFIVYVGDSRAYLLRDGTFSQLTRDHSKSVRLPEDFADLTPEQFERGLLVQFVGMKRRVRPVVDHVTLNPGDRLLLCTDGLTDPLDQQLIVELLSRHESPESACRALVDAANVAGGPDNITSVLVDFHGIHEVELSTLRAADTPASTKTKREVANWFHTNLLRIEQDLDWLQDGAQECARLSIVSAFAEVKRRLGAEVYTEFLRMHPTQNPSHVFHRACTMPNSGWRRRYESHLDKLEPNLTDITEGSIRLSSILSGDETAGIIRSLWRDWRNVEQRYFRSCQRDATHESEQTLNILIQHMLSSARTLIGLLEFFPQFMREAADEASLRDEG